MEERSELEKYINGSEAQEDAAPEEEEASAPEPQPRFYGALQDEVYSPEKEKAPRSTFGLSVVNIVLVSLTLCVVAAGFFFIAGGMRSARTEIEEKQQRINELEAEKELLRSDYVEAMNIINEPKPEGPPPVEGIDADSGKILLYDTDIGYIWVPIISALPLHTYKTEGFSTDERGRMSYTSEDGKTSSYFGIDVSAHQGDINWQLAKEDGVEFAFLRAGFRGYGEEGNLHEDEKFVQNYDGAHEAEIDLGVYFYSQAITPEEAVEEAQFLLSVLNGRHLEYPIVFDWETVYTNDDETARTDDVMPQTLTLSAIAFCETVKDAGYDAMIYTNKKTAVMKYDLRQLSGYPIWLASYNDKLTYCYDFDIWQYGTGQVDGIDGEVDINIAMIK